MARTKKTPEELAAARAERKRVDEENRQKNILRQQQEQAEFEKNRPTEIINLLKTARDLRVLGDQIDAPHNRFDDYNWGDVDSIDFDSLDVHYYLWGDAHSIKFDELFTRHTKRDFETFKYDFEQLKIAFETKLEVKRAAEAEAARVRAIRTTAMGKLTDEEKKVLGVR